MLGPAAYEQNIILLLVLKRTPLADGGVGRNGAKAEVDERTRLSRFRPAITGATLAIDSHRSTYRAPQQLTITAMTNEESHSHPHLVVLIHGIWTRARWMDTIAPVLKTAGFEVAATSYGQFSVPRFLVPIRYLHRSAMHRVYNDILLAIDQFKPARISVITHSFGTHVLATILKDHPTLIVHRIIFCGSILRNDFPFDAIQGQFVFPIMNETGTNDIWPPLAEGITWGYYSAAGTHGFNRPTVKSRLHEGFRHSHFLKPEFCRRFWVPFLRNGEELPASSPFTKLAWYVNLLAAMPLRWILPALAFAAVWRALR